MTMKITRRCFVQAACAGGALATLGTGCGNAVEAAPYLKLAPEIDGSVRLRVAEHPDLMAVGGAVTLVLPDQRILLIHHGENDFVATQSDCPHQGCPLGYSHADQMIECPCHSSRFLPIADVSSGLCAGAVTHLPARQGLDVFAVRYADGVVTVQPRRGSSCGAELPPLVAGKLTLRLSEFPMLAAAGGSIVGQPEGLAHKIVVLRADDTTIVALNAKCTHAGCDVAWQSDRFQCPCHGSSFELDGTVLEGIAPRPLDNYPVRFDGTLIEITVS
jgi:cytochrome b6-f complex iron-sulfur subunit